ncbi:MAG: hypothetical protein M1833_002231 [Piccolia ochrophora]|nr:MAG: hypothetical protein M1833_002231 [Piccolia ochrophora]
MPPQDPDLELYSTIVPSGSNPLEHSPSTITDPSHNEIEQMEFPPTDGFPLSFGVFQDYYTANDVFEHDQMSLAVIGTSASGILYLSSPIIFTLLMH